MYSFISGIIDEKTENYVVINNNGIGYEIACSTNTISALPMIGEKATIYTYFYASENNGVGLYGFLSKDEKKLFLQLISVSGIGPKMATTILSGMSITDLNNAIFSGDSTMLSKIKGLGKKTADRIVLELKDKVDQIDLFNYSTATNIPNGNINEAVDVLVNMGLSKYDATKLVRLVVSQGDSTEDIISKALKNMSSL
mgnify:FL=1